MNGRGCLRAEVASPAKKGTQDEKVDQFLLLLVANLLVVSVALARRWISLVVSGGDSFANNLFPVTINLDDLEDALADLDALPAEIFYRKHISLSLPLWQGRNRVFGVSYRQNGSYHTTGETLDFYRCLAEEAAPQENKYYALQAAYLEYSLFGGYYA